MNPVREFLFLDYPAALLAIASVARPTDPRSTPNSAIPAEAGAAYPLAASESASGDFLPPLFQLSGDAE